MEQEAVSWVWWWWVMACMMGWGGSSFLMGCAGRHLPYAHSFFYNTVGMTIGTVLVLMAIEEGGAGGERKAGKEMMRHHPAAAEAQLGWLDGSLAIFSGVAAALADIAFYQIARLGVSVSVAGPVSGLYLALPAVLGVVLLGEPLTWAKVVGLLLAMAAIYLLGSDGDDAAGSPGNGAEAGSAVVGLLSAQPHDQQASEEDQQTSGGESTIESMEKGSSSVKKVAAVASTSVLMAAEPAGEAVSPVAVKTRRRVDKAGART